MRKECVMDDMASGITDLGAASTETRGFEPETELDFPNGKPIAGYFSFCTCPPDPR